MHKAELIDLVRSIAQDADNTLLSIVAPGVGLSLLLYVLSGFPSDIALVIILIGAAHGVVATIYSIIAFRSAFDAPPVIERRQLYGEENEASIRINKRR
jgi:hypothetical protein